MIIEQIILEIDYRENAILSLLNPDVPIKIGETLYSIKNEERIKYKICNLPIGDFIFKKVIMDKNTEPISEIVLIIERKTFTDLCSSINDNRFREQKDRLLESIQDPSKIVYILEGNKNVPKVYNISKTTINSAIQNLIFKHCYKVITTQDTLDTIDNLILLYKKIESRELVGTIKYNLTKKVSNKDTFINQLNTISGVSIQVAKKIKEKYNNMNELISSYNEYNLHMLSEIMITEKRKIGKNLSEKIYNALFT